MQNQQRIVINLFEDYYHSAFERENEEEKVLKRKGILNAGLTDCVGERMLRIGVNNDLYEGVCLECDEYFRKSTNPSFGLPYLELCESDICVCVNISTDFVDDFVEIVPGDDGE